MRYGGRELSIGVSSFLLLTASANLTGEPLRLSHDGAPPGSLLSPRPRPFLELPPHKSAPYLRLQSSRLSLSANSKLRSAVSISLLSAGLYVALDRKSREWVKTKWEYTFSPNHAQAENKGPFRFRTYEEELSQPSHIDKWCHFVFAYLPFEPLTIYSQRFLEGLPGWLGGAEHTGEISGRAVLLSAAIVTGGSVLEEYLDGFQKDEGFSIQDLLCNLGGVTVGILRHKGYLKNLRVYWRFNGTPESWTYPWFDYMPGYSTRVAYDFSELFFGKNESEEPSVARFAKFIGYLPPSREEDREIWPWTVPVW